jgi:hypothetical protein
MAGQRERSISLDQLGRVLRQSRQCGFCRCCRLRRAASDTTCPTLFISGNANNVIGIFRSTNAGKSWTRINDDHHQWGSNWNRRRGSTRLWTRLSRHQWSRHHLRRSRFRKLTAVTGSRSALSGRSGASIVRDSALHFAVTRRSPTEIACKPHPFRG